MKDDSSEFKVSFNSQIKRFVVTKSFLELKQVIAKIFDINESHLNKYQLSYNDNETDSIIIDNNFDFEQVRNYMSNNSLKVLKLLITTARKPSCDFEFISKDDFKDENIFNNFVKIDIRNSVTNDTNNAIQKKKNDIIEPKVYDLLLDDLRKNFDLKKFSNQQILTALKQSDGETDLTLQALFK